MPRVRVKPTKSFFKRAAWLFMAVLFIVTALGFGILSFWQSTHQKDASQAQKQPAKLVGSKLPGYTPAPVSELKTTDQSAGTGKEAVAGSTVVVDYLGALATTGVIFDTSLDRGQPATFKIPDDVIVGFGQGIIGMKVGGTRQILIPAALGYGAQGKPPAIPPNSDLVFSVSLRDVK